MTFQTNPRSSIPRSLSEIERTLYIENSSVYQFFLLRVDAEFLKPYTAGYSDNMEKMEKYLTALATEIGLEGEELKNVLPPRVGVKTAQEFIQEQLF